MGIVEEEETSSSDASRERVARFPHDQEDSWDCKRTEGCWHRPISDIRHLVGDIIVANVLEEEIAIISYQPASEGKQQFSEWRVNVEEVGTLEIIRSKFTKVYFIEDHLGWVCDSPKASDEGNHSDYRNGDPVVPF